ncbi:MAG TPA: FtsX-like permease family protein, partial [Candidatus Dormibacteraeota bacterium]|nr:FtsX-like permease family protein [Candidatus Dormibacteraeota bacterium]
RDLAAFAVQLVAAQLLLVALYCVWLLAGTLLVQQQASISVWRSRGWSWRGVTSLLYLELLGVAVIACPFGLAAGWAVSENVARLEYGATAIAAFHFDLVRIGLPIAAVLAAELAILAAQAMLAARQGILASRTESSRPAIPWWRQRYLDLALAVLAIPLLAASGFLGSAAVRASADSQNPMLLLLPGLAVALLAIASLRLLPFLAAAVARLRVSIAGRLASLQLLRAPSQHSGLAVLLVLAVALGIFATTYVATAQKNGADRAAYQVGADVRGTFSGAVTTLPDQVALRGAASRSSVFRGYAHDGNEDVAVLAVDPYSFKPVMYRRADLASSPLPDLVQKLADDETGGLVLPAADRTISVWVHGSNTGGALTAHLADEHGRAVHADLGTLDFSGWRQLTASFIADTGVMGKQLRFRDLAISGVTTAGDVGLSSLSGGSVVLETFQELVTGPGAGFAPFLWWRTDWVSGARAENLLPSLDVPRDGQRTVHLRVVPASIPTYVRPNTTRSGPGFGAPSPGPVPALVATQLLNRFGLSIGKQMQIVVDGNAMTAVIVGVVDHFPSLYPELGDFIVLPRDPVLIQLAYGGHQRPFANEI